MKKIKLLFTLLAIAMVVPVSGQSREFLLDISVTASAGESLSGLAFSLRQLDYGMSYPNAETVLDADGKCSIRVYPGNHHIKIEKTGYTTFEQDFNVSADMELPITLSEAVREPFALKATLDHDVMTGKNNVVLSWNKEDPAFFDDFESYDDFAITFGDWTGIDGDRESAAPLLGVYPNRGSLQYATIINPLTPDPIWWYEYPVLHAYSGQQYVGFVRTNSGVANNDWLISPAITVGTDNILRFMAKAADRYKERFEVAVTTEMEPEVGDFKLLSSGNYEQVSYEEWQSMEYDLSGYAGQTVKLAIHYIGDANRFGAFMLMVDDFYVGQPDYEQAQARVQRVPQYSPANPNEKFEVYKNGELQGTTENYTWQFDDLADGEYTFGVKAVYKESQTGIVTLPFTVSNAGCSKVAFLVATNNGVVADGLSVNLINKESSAEYVLPVVAGKAEVLSLPNGDYLYSIASEMFEQVEGTLSVAGEKTEPVTLIEKIYEPYNVTVDLDEKENGKFDALVQWNQDLGFLDSFEEYEDFATGTFGEWRSLDNDKNPVYPIGLGSQNNIVSFPGSGSASAPTAIAPMVFNPYKTIPAMAPTDPAIMAPTGDKTVIFFSAQGAKNDKWLISPAFTVREGYEWSLLAKAYSIYPEAVEFCISAEADFSSYDVIDHIEEVPSGIWTEYSMGLDAYVGQTVYLGVHYVAIDTFILQVDDFFVGPSESTTAYVGSVLKYEVYLDGILHGDTVEPRYAFTDLDAGTHTVGIRSVYATGESGVVEYTFNAQSGIDGLTQAATIVAGGNGEIRIVSEGKAHVSVSNLLGQMVANEVVEGTAVIVVEPGIYLVNVNGKAYKVVVR